MNRREFIVKHLPKAAGGAVTSLLVAVGILQYRADESGKKLDKVEDRLRELEAYNSANVAQIQILLSDRKRNG